jgi:hypothetical protein
MDPETIYEPGLHCPSINVDRINFSIRDRWFRAESLSGRSHARRLNRRALAGSDIGLLKLLVAGMALETVRSRWRRTRPVLAA